MSWTPHKVHLTILEVRVKIENKNKRISKTMANQIFDQYLDLIEAARELGIHPQSLRRLIKRNLVPAQQFAGKYLIQRTTLEVFKANYDPRPGPKRARRLL
jgi:hypothetical protein